MVDAQAIREALGRVVDPELLRPLEELGSIRKVRVDRRGVAEIDLALVAPNHPQIALIEERLRVVCGSRPEIRSVSIAYSVMDDDQRAELMTRLRPQRNELSNPRSPTRVVAISSGKGGVGKSSVSANLGVSLVDLGQSVGILDADVWGFSIPAMLGVRHEPMVLEGSIIPPVAHGVKVISMDYFVPPDQAVIWRGPMLHKAVEQFLNDVWWDNPDFLLIDMPPGTGDVAISLSQFISRAEVIVVTTPQPTAQRVAKRAALMAGRVNQELVGIVENMSWFTGDDRKRYFIFGEGGGARLAEDLGLPLLARIPLDPALREGADRGEPATISAPGSEAAESFSALAAEVIARKPRIRTHPELVIR